MTSSDSSSRPVAVVGAAGHTGRFVIAELRRRGVDTIALVREGRARAAGSAEPGIEWRPVALDDPASLDRAIAGAGVVINCAGPFLDSAALVVRAALRAGSHYLDVTAEQESARRTLEDFDGAARRRGVAVIPAMGFFGGFADLLVTAAMRGWNQADSIEIMVGLDRWHPTRGTRLTGERNTFQRVVVAGGRLVPPGQPLAEKECEFRAPLGRQAMVEVPLSEIILISRHKAAVELHTFLSRDALSDIRDEATPAPVPADESGRSAQRFEVQAAVRRGDETRRVAARGRDIYAFSAPLVVGAAVRLLQGRFTGAGARAPGAAFDAAAMLADLAPDPLDLDLDLGAA